MTQTPYNGSSGWSGTSTSEARATERDTTGKTGQIQWKVMNRALGRGPQGITIDVLRASLPDEHHGTLSGALSVLHKAGKLARLTEVRNGCKVYVAPQFTLGRPCEPHGRPRRGITLTPDETDAVDRVRKAVLDGRALGISMGSVPVWALERVLEAIERNQ